ncbi:MAG TPA: OmpA family protein [Terriglobales bacterium]|jgi:outer membrane protein OmpA-like peptidoglycan-associated protein|nr:OmpA family protein [Terriglobales bacterium]
MMDSSRVPLKLNERGLGDAPGKSQGKLALALGVIAIALSLILGFVYLRSVRRLEREVAQLSQQTEALSQQTEALSRQVERVQEQSQTSAQQASQAAANAQAAAQERDLAKQAQSNSEAQAELARQQAAAEQQKADQATQQAEQYRQQREAELQQLQQALGQIAETRRTAMGLVMTLDSKSIRFDFDKAAIKPEYRDILNRIAGILMALKGYSVAVYGYTDDIGTQKYNLQLSQRRAEAVRDFLVQAGISPKIMSAKGFGKSDPRVPGDSDQARAANRRVEIGIVDSKLITNGPIIEPK